MRNYLTSNPAILNEARDYLDGLVLGDGHIHYPRGKRKTSFYTHSCEYKNWLDIINEDLYEYGIECGIDNGQLYTGGFNAEGGSIAFQLWTRHYIEFKEMHDRWYKPWYDIDNYPMIRWHKDEYGEYFIWQKVIPKDICLSSDCIANWYLGDGGIIKHKHCNGYHIRLATNDFLREDIIFLADLLSKVLNIKCGMTKAGEIGIYTQADINTFLNYIKEYKIDCYGYKFPEEAKA